MRKAGIRNPDVVACAEPDKPLALNRGYQIPWSAVALCGCIWLLYVTMHNGETITDSLMASTLIPCLFQGHGVDLSAANVGIDLVAAQPYYYWKSSRYGLIGIYPIGMSLLAAPIQILLWFLASAGGLDISLGSPFFNHTRSIIEKISASFLAAAAVLPLVWSLRLVVSRSTTNVVAAIYIFASSSLSLLAQGLWQQTGINLITISLLYSLLRNPKPLVNWSAALYFFALGFLFTIRPTAVMWSGFFALLYFRVGGRPSVRAVIGCALGLLPGVMWNVAVHGHLLGGYVVTPISSFDWHAENWLSRLGPMLLSPHKGLLIFNPLLLGVACCIVTLRRLEARTRMVVGTLLIAALCQLLLCLSNPNWHGGRGFGPRYLVEDLAVWFLLAAIGIDSVSSRFPQVSRCVVILVGAYSLVLHMFGAIGGRVDEPTIRGIHESMMLP
jgi:hypothetical protein